MLMAARIKDNEDSVSQCELWVLSPSMALGSSSLVFLNSTGEPLFLVPAYKGLYVYLRSCLLHPCSSATLSLVLSARTRKEEA